MSFNYASTTRSIQTERAKPDQVPNNAGGFVFKLTPMKQLERFFILGSDGPTYYQTARALSRENAGIVIECWKSHPRDTMNLMHDMITENRAIKVDPIIFALALGTLTGELKTRQLCYSMIPSICRTASHIFMFVDFCTKLQKGWGRGLKRAIGNTYHHPTGRALDHLALQMVKYRNRNSFTHQRLLRLSHPIPATPENANVFNWCLGKEHDDEILPEIIKQYKEVTADPSVFHKNLPWEAYPTDRIPWSKLAPDMPWVALVRNLNKFDLRPLSELEKIVVTRLRNERPQMHPFNILFALKTYSGGRGFRGSLTWTPNQQVCAALEAAYYEAFKYVQPSGDRHLVALDVSGSMSVQIANSNISAREASAAMAMTILRTEPRTYVKGFSHNLVDVPISQKTDLGNVIQIVSRIPMGSTDCSLPMVHALQEKIEVDKFVVFTDNETYAGRRHPFEALKDYRKAMGINAKLIVCGMTATGFSIADPSDPGMLDIVGCDSALPQLISSL